MKHLEKYWLLIKRGDNYDWEFDAEFKTKLDAEKRLRDFSSDEDAEFLVINIHV